MVLNKNTVLLKTLSCVFLSLSIGFVPLVKAEEILEQNERKICPSELSQKIDNILAKPQRASENWGIIIENLETKEVLYQLNSNKYFIPASSTKLFTTATSLIKLGKDFTIKTPIYYQGNAPVVDTLIIEGKGDPSLKKENLEAIATELQKIGVKSIKQLILVDNYLQGSAINYSWEFSDIFYYYAVPINSLILDDNIVTLTLNPSRQGDRVLTKWSNPIAAKQWQIINQGITTQADSEYNIELKPSLLEPKLTITGTLASNADDDDWWLAIPDPAQYFQETLLEILTSKNISISASTIVDYSQYKSELKLENKQLLLELISPDLKELITTVNQNSDNLYAEVLFKYLMLDTDAFSSSVSVAEILTNLGIELDDYQFKDGSGLSRHNLVKPIAIITLLKSMNESKYQDIFRNSLSLAGENGTLKKRFQNTPIANNLWAKTGTLSGISALSGYLKLANYDDLVFTVMVNQSTENNQSLRTAIDDIILTVGKLKVCK